MIRVEAIEDFTLADFKKINIKKRKLADVEGSVFKGDIFECEEDMVKYLMGNNRDGKTVIKILEVEPTGRRKRNGK